MIVDTLPVVFYEINLIAQVNTDNSDYRVIVRNNSLIFVHAKSLMKKLRDLGGDLAHIT